MLDKNQQDHGDLDQVALAGELARHLVHDCNNFLNTLLLQITLMQPEASEQVRADLLTIREQGKALARLIQEWQRFSRSSAGPKKTDLNSSLREAGAKLPVVGPGAAIPLAWMLAPDSLWVQGSAGEVHRLCSLLLLLARELLEASSRVPATLEVHTETRSGMGVLRLARAGPNANNVDWLQCFTAVDRGTAGQPRLVPASCQNIVQRLHGKMHVDVHQNGGSALVVEIPLAK